MRRSPARQRDRHLEWAAFVPATGVRVVVAA